MVRAGVLTLIADNPKAHGVFDITPDTIERDVFCTIKSVTRTEAYVKRGSYGVSGTLAEGLNPSIVFVLSCDADYQDEAKCRYDGKNYAILRTYLTDDGGIELTAGRFDDDT